MSSNIPLIPADGQPITTVDELNDVLVQAAGRVIVLSWAKVACDVTGD